MKILQKTGISLFLIVVLLAFTACGTQTDIDTSSGAGNVSTPQTTETPVFTAEDASALFSSTPNSFPNFVVDEVIPYGADFLVIRRAEHGSGEAILHWVFSTGQEVNIWNGYAPAYSILGPGVVQIESDGKSPMTDWQGMPERTTRVAAEETLTRMELNETILLPVEQSWTVGFPLPDPWENTEMVGRYAQLFDAQLGVIDLQFSFIPSGDPERFQTFFPAAATAPTAVTSFDPDTRRFTLRLHNTCLCSGGITDEEIDVPSYKGLYPYAFPEGSLGADTPWFSNALVVQEGEDTLVALTLSPDVLSYRIETGNLGYDTIPWLRVAFSNQESNWNCTSQAAR